MIKGIDQFRVPESSTELAKAVHHKINGLHNYVFTEPSLSRFPLIAEGSLIGFLPPNLFPVPEQVRTIETLSSLIYLVPGEDVDVRKDKGKSAVGRFYWNNSPIGGNKVVAVRLNVGNPFQTNNALDFSDRLRDGNVDYSFEADFAEILEANPRDGLKRVISFS